MNLQPLNSNRNELQAAADLLRERIGQEVPEYRYEVLAGALKSIGEGALGKLKAGEDRAWRVLIHDMTVPETLLFRIPEHFQILRDDARARALAGQSYHVLSAGCSTGEEVWSIAAVLDDVYADANKWSVTGWDVDAVKLEVARAGRFRRWSARTGLAGYERYFRQKDDWYFAAEHLHDNVRFDVVNLMGTLPEAQFDAIFFRNVSIYWRPDVADRVKDAVAQRLRPEGLMLVGSSDPFRFPRTEWIAQFRGTSVSYRRRENPITESHARRNSVLSISAQPSLSTPKNQAEKKTARPNLSPRPAAKAVEDVPVTVPARISDAEREAILSEATEALQRAQALADSGALDEALEILSAIGPGFRFEAELLSGAIFLEQGKYREAAACFQKCVFERPMEPAYRKWLSVALERQGLVEEAARERRNADVLKESGHGRAQPT